MKKFGYALVMALTFSFAHGAFADLSPKCSQYIEKEAQELKVLRENISGNSSKMTPDEAALIQSNEALTEKNVALMVASTCVNWQEQYDGDNLSKQELAQISDEVATRLQSGSVTAALNNSEVKNFFKGDTIQKIESHQLTSSLAKEVPGAELIGITGASGNIADVLVGSFKGPHVEADVSSHLNTLLLDEAE